MGGRVKSDPRHALFGGAFWYDSLGSEEIAVHPHLARLWLFSVDIGETASLLLPSAAARHLGEGLAMLVVNRGAPGAGTLQMLDADSDPIEFSDGTFELQPGYAAEVYVRDYTNPDEPTWAIFPRGVGVTAKL